MIHHSHRIPHETLHDLETAIRCCVAVAASFVSAAAAGIELLAVLARSRPRTHPLDRSS